MSECIRLLHVQGEAVKMRRREAWLSELLQEERRLRRLQKSLPMARLWQPAGQDQHCRPEARYVQAPHSSQLCQD